jgi:AraC-like DNA-binding protein
MSEKFIHSLVTTKSRVLSEKALEQGKLRSDKVCQDVHKALETIDAELLLSNGIYPKNDGNLSMAEIARRADVHPTTFYTINQKELRHYVKGWLQKKLDVRPKQAAKEKARKSPSERIADLQKVYESTCQQQRVTELELQECESKLAKVSSENALLRAHIERLSKTLKSSAGGVVVPFAGDLGH